MDSLLYARAQMGLSLAFHIVFAAAGVALPLLMAIADTLHWRTGDRDWLALSKKLAKGTSVLFAVGAVSGTVLSFELGLLWPRFMGTFGEVVGVAFSLEGFAFFTEAIFLGIYLYGRGKLPRGLHLASGYAVAVSGAASAFFVTLVSAVMNLPHGFELVNGAVQHLEPWKAIFSPPWKFQTVHVLLSSYQATAWAMAGIHAAVLLRSKAPAAALSMHRKALEARGGDGRGDRDPPAAQRRPLGADTSPASSPGSSPRSRGSFRPSAARRCGSAACRTSRPGRRRTRSSCPRGLSLLAFHDPDAEVKGLEDFPRDTWAPVAKVHLAFQMMVGTGSWMALLAVATGAARGGSGGRSRSVRSGGAGSGRGRSPGPLGLVALEAGWLVTEWGRQPFIVHGMMRTADAVTPFPALAPPFWTFTGVYLLLAAVVSALLYRQVRSSLPAEVAR